MHARWGDFGCDWLRNWWWKSYKYNKPTLSYALLTHRNK